MSRVKITPKSLTGTVTIPPSKSLSHRAIICAALANGESSVDNIIFSDDIIATSKAMESLGVKMNMKDSSIEIQGNDSLKLVNPEIDCIESGSTLRFIIPIALLTSEEVTFKGRGRLTTRPLTTYYNIFDKEGITYDTRSGLPLKVKGSLKPSVYEVEGNISSQFITGLMFTLPLLNGDSSIKIIGELESKGYVDLTIDVLKQYGVEIQNNNYEEFIIKGNQKYKAQNYRVEGDYSQVAFFIVAGLLGGEITCLDMRADSLQGDREIIDIVRTMGGRVDVLEDKIIVYPSKTHGATIDASQCPDLVPIIATLAALSEGETRIINAARVRIKESDRLEAMRSELNKIGADVKETPDGLVIKGKFLLDGGVVDGWNDHRIVMAMAMASIRCTSDLIIEGSEAIKKSYPTFFEDFRKLGGKVDELDAR
ncbi:3-phosphoshikimate 1-carboxyvinyltransferase [Clostridium cylindrosporum]|uniref:3-phosphoshikimate 1-carboxyvinyltransferase n=1 Tax=Clostridium cylindrosporum DSM 605 TaxID=1121307 RepID=A0A0J8D9K0_CLOCY|nr:3-phosphoshikimate 1-carboxyvinyltransferase [Clostridium cylindrosporum]KMT22725.1 3-phosphoshikimate 1-carboxyvinyltransferase AroA [Clostridium cylindrosporum DSM 605]